MRTGKEGNSKDRVIEFITTTREKETIANRNNGDEVQRFSTWDVG